MAFPTTPVLDGFAGTDGLLNTGSWGVLALDGTALSRIGNQAGAATAGFRGSYYTPSTFPIARLEAHGRLAVLPAGSDSAYLSAYLNPTSAAANGYALEVNPNQVPANVKLYKVSAGSTAQLGATINTAAAVGDQWGFQALLSADTRSLALILFRNGAPLGVRTDASTPHAGNVSLSLEMENTVGRWDDFGGGIIAPSRLGLLGVG